MSDNSVPSNVHEIPGATRFNVRGQSFQLDLLDTIYDFHDLAEEVHKKEGSHRDYLNRIIEHIHQQTGMVLTFGEADWLNDELEIEFARAKKKRRDAIAAALSSPSSTASTPAD